MKTIDHLYEDQAPLVLNYSIVLGFIQQLLEAFSPLLGQQTQAIIQMAEKIAESGFLPLDEAQALINSSYLHNLGYLSINRDLLHLFHQSPSALTADQQEAIEQHPIHSQQLAKQLEVCAQTLAAIRSHHERWDGTGYPDQLSMYAIPPVARHLAIIIFFVECGLSNAQAAEKILDLSGKAFDPEAVRLFLKIINPLKLPKNLREVLLQELQVGMILGRSIYSPNGLLLFPEKTKLDEAILKKIHDHHLTNPISQRILIFNGCSD